MTSSTDNSKAEKWQKLLSRLSPTAQAQIAGSATESLEPEEASDLQSLRRKLSPAARQAVSGELADTKRWPVNRSPKYCLVQCPDGDFPSLEICRDAEALAKRVRELDGSDVSVWLFYGIPIPITRRKPRVLIFPDGRYVRAGDAVVDVDPNDLDMSIQDDGFLGPVELSVTRVTPPEGVDTNQADDDDDFDDHDGT